MVQVRTDGPQKRARHNEYRALHKLASALYGVIASRRQLREVTTLRPAEVPLRVAYDCACCLMPGFKVCEPADWANE